MHTCMVMGVLLNHLYCMENILDLAASSTEILKYLNLIKSLPSDVSVSLIYNGFKSTKMFSETLCADDKLGGT